MEVIIRKKVRQLSPKLSLEMSNHDHRIRNVSEIVQGKPYNKFQKIITHIRVPQKQIDSGIIISCAKLLILKGPYHITCLKKNCDVGGLAIIHKRSQVRETSRIVFKPHYILGTYKNLWLNMKNSTFFSLKLWQLWAPFSNKILCLRQHLFFLGHQVAKICHKGSLPQHQKY